MKSSSQLRQDFPIFSRYPDLAYLDNAATTQKPRQVISAVTDFYERVNSNVHRGIYDLSQQSTSLYEKSREKVSEFIGAANSREIIFTGNASEAINLVALGYVKKHLRSGDIVVISAMEHHSNYVPWLKLKKDQGIKLMVLPLTSDYRLKFLDFKISKSGAKRIKFVSLTHASNVLGTLNPVSKIISHFKSLGIKAKYLVDAAQSLPHVPINVKKLDCDFLVFSSHKMLGPSGVGVLWGKSEHLLDMDPVFTGSHMISEVKSDSFAWADLPDKFEVGTGRLEAVVGLGAAIDYLNNLGMPNIQKMEKDLTDYAVKLFSASKDIKLYGSQKSTNRLGVFSFNLKGIHPHDVAEILNRRQVCVRAGHHCAQPLLANLGVTSTVRASIYIYNTKSDIDRLFTGLQHVWQILKP